MLECENLHSAHTFQLRIRLPRVWAYLNWYMLSMGSLARSWYWVVQCLWSLVNAQAAEKLCSLPPSARNSPGWPCDRTKGWLGVPLGCLERYHTGVVIQKLGPWLRGRKEVGEGEGIAVDAVSHALLLGLLIMPRGCQPHGLLRKGTAGYYAKSIKFRYKDLDLRVPVLLLIDEVILSKSLNFSWAISSFMGVDGTNS